MKKLGDILMREIAIAFFDVIVIGMELPIRAVGETSPCDVYKKRNRLGTHCHLNATLNF